MGGDILLSLALLDFWNSLTEEEDRDSYLEIFWNSFIEEEYRDITRTGFCVYK